MPIAANSAESAPCDVSAKARSACEIRMTSGLSALGMRIHLTDLSQGDIAFVQQKSFVVRKGLACLLGAFFGLAFGATRAYAQAIVINGYFTNVYVYPNSDKETWEQHLASLRSQTPCPIATVSNADAFSRACIDAFTRDIMRPTWPSYFDPLAAYTTDVFGLDTKYIHPPQFFGSGVALKRCVDAALKDAYQGVLQWDTVRTLANCHDSGLDPSPQLNLIVSPDIRIAGVHVPVAHGAEMCTAGEASAWHAWGIGVPNFTVLPTSVACHPNFASFTKDLTHEVVELLTDPGGAGYFANFPDYEHEAADLCGDPETTVVDGFLLARYVGGPYPPFVSGVPVPGCQPRLDPPSGSVAQTWILGQGSPLMRLTGQSHELTLAMPASRATTDATLTQAIIVIQTGDDDLRGGDHAGDNADVRLTFVGGQTLTTNVNKAFSWGNHTTHSAILNLPSPPPRVSDITSVTISTNFGGGLGGDNWNIDRVALVVSFPFGSTTTGPIPPAPVIHDWLIASELPLIRFTGQVHDLVLPINPQDLGQAMSALSLTISTGNDNLRGGSNPGDNCDVTIQLSSGPPIVLKNVNAGQTWDNWTNHTISIPLPAAGLHGGDVTAVIVHTGFGGGIGGDNWNLEQMILEATLTPPPCNGCAIANAIAAGCTANASSRANLDPTHGTVDFRSGASGHIRLTCPVRAALLSPTSLDPNAQRQLVMTFYNDHGFAAGVNHCSITADFRRSNLNSLEAGADAATITTANQTFAGRQTLSANVQPLDLSTSYYWVDVDLFRDSPAAACNPVIVGVFLK